MKKIKQASTALHPDIVLWLFAGFTAIAIGVRTYQMMYIFEPDTGFYFIEAKDNLTLPLLYALVGASCLLYLVLSFLSTRKKEFAAPEGKNYFMATGSVLFSITLVIDGMLRSSELFAQYGSEYGGFWKFLIQTKSFPLLGEIVFALLAALYFVIVGVSYFKGNGAHKASKVMSLSPVCWLMFRLVRRFVRAVSFIRVSELFWELIMIALMMLFFLGFARIVSGVEEKGKFPATMGVGLCGSMVAFMVSLSRILTYLFAGTAYLSADSPIELCDFGAGVIACMFILSCLHNLQPKNAREEKPAAAPAPAEPTTPMPAPVREDEAFRIAEQYANRYITEDPIAYSGSVKQPEEPQKTEDEGSAD